MRLARVEKLNLSLSAGAVAASFAFATPHFATSLALGAALEAINFGALYRGAELLFAGEINGSGPWVGLLGLRFGLLGAGIFFAILAGVNPVALVIGLSLAVPAVLLDAWLNRPPVGDHDTLPALSPEDPSWDRHNVWRAHESFEDQIRDPEEEEA